MKLPPWSFSNLRDAENCLRQYHHKHVLRDVPFEETDAPRWGNSVHSAMETRLKTGAPLVDGFASYETFVPAKTNALRGLIEFKMGMRQDGTHCDFFDKVVWGRGKLDFALVNHEAHTAAIVDWKTGKLREDPDELEIFALLLKAKYPALQKIAGWYVWLKEMKMGRVYDLSDTNGKLANVKHRLSRIALAASTDSWEPRQGPLCGWCGVKSCEFRP